MTLEGLCSQIDFSTAQNRLISIFFMILIGGHYALPSVIETGKHLIYIALIFSRLYSILK